jgi:hypothetical protein
MGQDDITLVSTTDSAEQVQAALTGKPAAEKPADKPADSPPADAAKAAEPGTPAEPDKPAPPPADETAEQKDARETKEASEAGSRLALRRAAIQQEINDLTRNKHNVRRDVEAEEARLSELRRQREALETKPVEPAPKTDEKKAEGRTEPQLDATDEQGNAKYSTYEEYLSDHAKWNVEQAELAARRVVEQERKAERERIEHDSTNRAVNERLAHYNTAIEEFKKTHADFDAAVAEMREAVQDTFVAMGPNALQVVDGYTVFDAQDGPALTYYFLKHHDELKAIAAKPPQQQLIALVRLEERLRAEGASSSTPARPPATPETKAPAPIKPVGAGPTATTVPLDEEPYQDFKLRRERELKSRRSA